MLLDTCSDVHTVENASIFRINHVSMKKCIKTFDKVNRSVEMRFLLVAIIVTAQEKFQVNRSLLHRFWLQHFLKWIKAGKMQLRAADFDDYPELQELARKYGMVKNPKSDQHFRMILFRKWVTLLCVHFWLLGTLKCGAPIYHSSLMIHNVWNSYYES